MAFWMKKIANVYLTLTFSTKNLLFHTTCGNMSPGKKLPRIYIANE